VQAGAGLIAPGGRPVCHPMILSGVGNRTIAAGDVMVEDADLKLEDPDLEEKEIEEGKAAALLAYIPFLCFVPLIKMRDNRYAVAHGRQGLVLLLIEIIAAVLLVPKISMTIWQLVLIACLGLAIAGVFQVLQGRWFRLPLVGDIAERLKL